MLINQRNSKGITIGTFYNVKAGTSPISTCKTGDYQTSLYDKIQIDSLISSVTNQINSLATRVTNLENNPYPATYTMYDPNYYTINGSGTVGGNNVYYYTQVENYQFYLPKPTYVNIEVSGQYDGIIGGNEFDLVATIDSPTGYACNVQCFGRQYSFNSSFWPWTGFQMAGSKYLSAGYHSIQIAGFENGIQEAFICSGTGVKGCGGGGILETYISVAAVDKGTTQNQVQIAQSSPITLPTLPSSVQKK